MSSQLIIRLLGIFATLIVALSSLYVPQVACADNSVKPCCAMAEPANGGYANCCKITPEQRDSSDPVPSANYRTPSFELVSALPRKAVLSSRVQDEQFERTSAINRALVADAEHWMPNRLYLLTRCLLI
jgi:hypothetical protein